MKDILSCFKQLLLNFTFGIKYLSTHFGAKLLSGADGFLILFSSIVLDIHGKLPAAPLK